MAVHNGAAFLREAVDSVLNQSFGDFEFLIVDDNSNDDSLAILESYADKRIVIVRNLENLGLTKSLNKLIRMATGEFIARMDADDVCMANRFEKQIDFFIKNENVSMCGTFVHFFDEVNFVEIKYPAGHAEIKFKLLFGNQFAHSTVMWNRELFAVNNLYYDETFFQSQDYDLWCRVVQKLTVANVQDFLLKYRMHDKQISEIRKDAQNNFSYLIKSRQFAELGVDFDVAEKFFLSDIASLNLTKKSLLHFMIDFHSIVKILYFKNLESNIYSSKVIFKYANSVLFDLVIKHPRIVFFRSFWKVLYLNLS